MYLKIGEVVTIVKSSVDFFEDFSFSSIRIIIGCEIFSANVNLHYSTFPLSLVFPMEGIIVGRTYSIASFSM